MFCKKNRFPNGGTYTMKRISSLIITFLFFISIAQAELSIREKIEGRSRPSIFSAWSDWFVNKPDMLYAEMTAAHDLLVAREFGLRF